MTNETKLNELQLKLIYAKEFTPHKVGYYEQQIKDLQYLIREGKPFVNLSLINSMK
jgi:hypothetical protein